MLFQLQNGFGDDGKFIFDEEEHEESDEMEEAPEISSSIKQIENLDVPHCASIDIDQQMDENMNDIVASPGAAQQEDNEAEKSASKPAEDPLGLMASLSPLKPPAVVALRKSKGNRRQSVFKDENKTISLETMQKHIDK